MTRRTNRRTTNRRRTGLAGCLLAALVLTPPAAARAPSPSPVPSSSQANPHPSTQSPPPPPVDTGALVNQQLDAVVDLEQRNRPLPEVLRAIGDITGIPFTVDEAVWDLLPYGHETPITANARGTPLRRTLDALTRTLGLTYSLRANDVLIRPLPALARTGRRATVQEIAGLDLLAREPLDLIEERPTVARMLEAVDLRLQQLDTAAREKGQPEPGYKVEARLDDLTRDRPVFVRRGATLLQALEAIHEQTKATWYPWGDSFIVLPKDAWVRRQLDNTVDLAVEQIDVQQALLELERAAGVPFTIEPGAIQRIPPEYRRVRLSLLNTSVRSALESLGSVTGLGYSIDDGGVLVYHTDAPANGPPAYRTAAAAEPPVLMVDLGDGSTLLLYPSDLPDDLRARLRARREQAIDKLRQTLPPEPQN